MKDTLDPRRLAYNSGRADERAAVVAWLRDYWSPLAHLSPEDLARRIEASEPGRWWAEQQHQEYLRSPEMAREWLREDAALGAHVPAPEAARYVTAPCPACGGAHVICNGPIAATAPETAREMRERLGFPPLTPAQEEANLAHNLRDIHRQNGTRD